MNWKFAILALVAMGFATYCLKNHWYLAAYILVFFAVLFGGLAEFLSPGPYSRDLRTKK